MTSGESGETDGGHTLALSDLLPYNELMEQPITIRFRKMNGLGNDFVILDARKHPVAVYPAMVRAIADREDGIGCDQLVLMEPGHGAGMDVFMRIWNRDGGEVAACGNATRCVAGIVLEETGEPQAVIGTKAGRLLCTASGPDRITVDMGTPRFDWHEIPLAQPVTDTSEIALGLDPAGAPALSSPSVVNIGNPHCIFWVEDVETFDLAEIGPILEHHPIFPEGANISLATVIDDEHIAARVWERGAGLTRACGTAACAIAAAAARKGLVGRSVRVALPGGELDINWREGDDHSLMTGAFAHDHDGLLPPHLLEPATSHALTSATP